MTTPAGESVVVALLGEVALRRDGALTALPGARSRLLLASLALRRGRSRSTQALIDDVWGEQPPRAPMNALHTQVSRLRSALPDGTLEIGPAGYRLNLAIDQVDLALAGDLLRTARRDRERGDAAGCLDTVDRVRSLWRGEPGADLPPGEVADALRAHAADSLADLDLVELAAREDIGDLDGALRLARRMAASDPLDEPAESTLMRLLAAAGRANEALESFAAFRARLSDQLGADPGPALIRVNTAILRGEPIGRGDSDAPAAGSRSAGSSSVSRIVVGDVADSAVNDPTPAMGAESASGGGDRSVIAEIASFSGPVSMGPASVAAAPQFDGSTSGRLSAVTRGETRRQGPERATPSAIGLRAAPNALLGRESDLDAIERLLHTSRVTTVLGPGGAGKTRVANEVGARVAHTGQVVLVELAPVRAEAADARIEVEAAINAALGLSDNAFDSSTLRTGYAADPRRRLRDAVAARSMVLILDNCEHLIDAVAMVVADLIGVAPRLTVLTTSRAPLMITAETVYPLPPLTIDAAGSPATELFAARARAVRPTVRLDGDIVAELCRTLDGLPLAIELAAARVRVMSVEEITTRLADRFALLRHGDRSSPERHRTLHAVIDWSWNLLDEPQRVTLRRLCRFPAGFGPAAAEAVAGGPEVGDVMAAVDGLVNQSLLTVFDDDVLGTRYRMLETVREYGEEQLAASPGESESVIERMMFWAYGFADATATEYLDGNHVELALAVTTELDNLLAVLRYAIERRDARIAYTVFPVVGMLWVVRGSHTEVVAWACRVVELDESFDEGSGPRSDLVLTTFEMMFLHLFYTTNDVRHLARLRIRVRRLLRTRTDIDETYRFIGEMMLTRADGAGAARRVAEAVRYGRSETKATALLLRANVKENQGDVRGSTRDAIRALEAFGQGHFWSVAMVCSHLGQVFGQIAKYPESVTYYRRSLGMLLRLGVYEDTVETRSMLAASLIGAGEVEQARRELEIAMGTTDIGTAENAVGMHNRVLAMVVASAAELAFADGDMEEGLRRYDRALRLFGWPHADLGPGPGALMLAAAALDARVLHGRAETSAGLARQILDKGVAMLSQYQDLPQIGGIACAIGSYLVATGLDPDRGTRLLALAPEVYARQDFSSMRLDRHVAAAGTRLGTRRVHEVIDRHRRTGRKKAAREIMRLLGELRDAR
ncbi:BTAD domain-containing putative transcriptional regulator [Nocardia sp. NPDC005366]|uniref:AfsR/SARP family transcriptional regulator n=1 Tax=Nocardia sp. NPDC005366 TaxID=3156878 RepID=UPI0033B310A4